MSFLGAIQPVVLNRGAGTHLDVLGETITLLVSGQQTNGVFTVTKMKPCPGSKASASVLVGSA